MADYDSPEHWPPVSQLTLGCTIWPVPGRAVPEIADTRRCCLEWEGPGHPVRFNRGRHGRAEEKSGPCDTQEQPQRAVEAVIAVYFAPLIHPQGVA
jgi:hypothetical protein